METDEDRPTIPSNTALAALAADVGGMVETGISVIANLGHQIGVLFPQLPASDEGERPTRPRSPVADLDGYGMAMHLRECYMRTLVVRMARELNGEEISADKSPRADGPSPDPQGPVMGG